MPYTFTLKTTLPTTPKSIYNAWLSSEQHAAMTGGGAEVDPAVGGLYEAWDGYITGKTLELTPNKRILQSWRTSDFQTKEEDSMIEVLLEAKGAGTELTLIHSNVPDRDKSYENTGWEEFYFAPMREWFEGEG